MTLSLEIGLAIAGSLGTLVLVGRWPRLALSVAIVAAAAIAATAMLSGVDDAFVIGGTGLQASEASRLVAAGSAAGIVLLALLGLTEGSAAAGAAVGGAGLAVVAGSVLAIAVDDATVGFAALGASGIVAVAVPALARWALGREEHVAGEIAAPALAAVAGAGLLGLVLAAWSQSPGGPLGSGAFGGADDESATAATGLAIVAMAAIVALRAGAIPMHLWAARLVGVTSPLAVPAILAWGTAAFAIVAGGWGGAALVPPLDDLDRWAIVIVALASVVFGGLASMLHDDLEHVLGYLLVQNAGVTLLAFASLRPEAVDALTSWVVATAAVATAFAGWIAAIRWTFGSHRVNALRGWARRSPVLAIAFLLVLGGSVGFPGAAVFGARVVLASEAVPGLLGTFVVVLALSPLVALGRVLVAGVGQPAPDVAGASDERLGRTLGTVAAWSRGGAQGWLRAGAAVVRANQGLGVSLVAALLGVIGLALAVGGVSAAAGA